MDGERCDCGVEVDGERCDCGVEVDGERCDCGVEVDEAFTFCIKLFFWRLVE